MKILILGAKGSLGQEFMEAYRDHEVFGWDRNDLDVTDEEAVNKKVLELKPELIINCAAYNGVDKAEEDRGTAEAVNGYAVGYLAKAAAELNIPMVHYSTGQVFDGSNPDGYNEDDMPHPANAYGMSKYLGEMELQRNSEQFYLIRTCWLYGKPAAGKKSFTDMMLDMSANDQAIRAVDDEFGNPTYVKDLAQATRALIEQKKPFGIYHIANSGTASRFDWAREIFAIRNIKANVEAVKGESFLRKAKRPQYEVLNNKKFIELRPWTEALREYLE